MDNFQCDFNSNTSRRWTGTNQKDKVERQIRQIVLFLAMGFKCCATCYFRWYYGLSMQPKIGFERRWVIIFGLCYNRSIVFYPFMSSLPQLRSWPCPWAKPSAAGTSRKLRSWAAGCPSSLSLWQSLSTARHIPKLPLGGDKSLIFSIYIWACLPRLEFGLVYTRETQ